MSKTFRPWDIDQAWLLPPSVHDFVASDHPAHLIREIVREELDLGTILATYEEPRGYPPFHPGMMTALLLHAYARASTPRGGSPGRVRNGSTLWR